MQSRYLAGLVLVSTAIAVLTGVVIANAIRQNAEPNALTTTAPALRITADGLHFGDVWEQQGFVWPVTVVNTSASVQQITGLSGSCSCQSFSPQEFTLRPGESRQIELKLDLRANHSQALAERVEDFEVDFWAKVKGEPKEIVWKLTGGVKHTARCPDHIDLGRVSESAPEKGAVEFGVRPFVVLSRFRIVPGTPWVKTELKRVGDNYAIKVIPESGLNQRDFATKLEFELFDEDGRELPKLTIPVKFTVGSDIVAEPESVNFGDREAGELLRENITIHSLSGQKLKFVGAKCTADGFKCNARRLADSINLQLNQTACKSYEKHPLSIVVCDEANVMHTLDVPLHINVRPKAALEKQP